MGNVEKFEINLEHDIDEQYQYEPGEMIRGHVSLVLTEPIKVKTITIQIKGEATVSWEDENAKNVTPYRADETYIAITHSLLTTKSGESVHLETGKHSFPVEYILPQNLPSSFIGKFGSITYVVKATLKEAKKFGLSTMITSEPFLVLRRLDLSREPTLLKLKVVRAEKRLWGALAFCLSGRVSSSLTVNKTGHLPGEDIFMDAEITNSSPRIVKAVQASIVMHSTFHAKTRSRHNTQIVNKKRDEWEMSYGEGRRWKNVRLTIPPYIPESRLDGCDIIDISYELVFKIEVSGGNEMKMVVPITVGTMQGDSNDERPRIYQTPGIPTPDQYGTTYPTVPDTQNGEVNKDGDEDEHIYSNGELPTVDDEIDLDMPDEEAQKFRLPLECGETRNNPLFNNAND